MHFRIKPFNDIVKEMYDGHGHFHEGDAGIDLFIIQEQITLNNNKEILKNNLLRYEKEYKKY